MYLITCIVYMNPALKSCASGGGSSGGGGGAASTFETLLLPRLKSEKVRATQTDISTTVRLPKNARQKTAINGHD